MAYQFDDLKNIDLVSFQESIVGAIRAAMPGLVTVEFYRDDETEELPTPACLLEVAEWDFDGEDTAGTGQQCVTLRLRARLIFSREAGPIDTSLRVAGLALAAAISKKRFPGGSGPANLLMAAPDDFHPRARQFGIWLTEWTQEAYVGESVWVDAAVPTAVYIGFVPDVGPEHVADYIQIGAGAP